MHIEKKIGVFNLLMPNKILTSGSELGIEIGGYHWTLEKQSTSIPDQANTYTCVSYSWSSVREPNSFYQGQDMSGRAMPVLETAIRALGNITDSSNKTKSPSAIWIDAFCVPPYGRERETCLRSMGAIYGNAAKVLAVLLPSSSAVLKQVRVKDKIDIETLQLLEQDDWAMRAWTYQEVVNSKTIYFIAEGEHEMPVRGDKFFDAVVKARLVFGEGNRYDSFAMDSLFPHLMRFEWVILDWRTGDYLNRSVYQVILSIELREAEQRNDLVHAMIGAITAELPDDKDILSTSPEEYFMQTCEAKNDFSFIYTTGRRSNISGRCWRPVAERLQVVMPMIGCFGEGQQGILYPTHLQLDNVCIMSPGIAPEKKINRLIEFLDIGNGNMPRNDWAHFILKWLRRGGFKGCGECIEIEHGLFFPQEPILDFKDINAIVATGVKFVFGAPGLLVKGNGTDAYHFCGVGVFFGQLSNTVSINVGK